MSLRMASVTIDTHDPLALAAFWSAALDLPVDDGASPYFTTIGRGAAGPGMSFCMVPEAKAGKNRCHVDLSAADREAEVERLVALGARREADHDLYGHHWTVLLDPHGNEFCIGSA
ncbi:MAG TPA: VOC family protein [Cryptosporangiaceae bacterium]|nr:VOC family protein [Cryptosporangiaceae bacterium]